MTIDPSNFYLYNVADTCSIWNILSSNILYTAASSAGCSLCFTHFVYYECLYKPRKFISTEEEELRERLRDKINNGHISSYPIDIEDLQEIAILEKRKNLSKGELSSIAFAKKTRLAFLTDDQGARKLANQVIDSKMVQTIPHPFGWLFFTRRLNDKDKAIIINEHKRFKRPLSPYFEEIYKTAIRYRTMSEIH